MVFRSALDVVATRPPPSIAVATPEVLPSPEAVPEPTSTRVETGVQTMTACVPTLGQEVPSALLKAPRARPLPEVKAELKRALYMKRRGVKVRWRVW